LWLHWRLRVNQLKRGGTANAVLLAILAVGALLIAGIFLIVLFLVGLLAFRDARPAALLYTWDAIIGVFLFFWLTSLVADLQRSEAISLDKFLHLPVSVSGVFALNYVSSLFSLSLILFAPMMIGLNLGLIFALGPALLLLLPLVAALLLMVTAVTYQFQGWLASLMVNKRRRRTVIVVVTMVFVVLAQLPNLINLVRPWQSIPEELTQLQAREQNRLDREVAAGKITPQERDKRNEELVRKLQIALKQRTRHSGEEIEYTVRLVSLCLPPGWVALGAVGLAEGNVLPALLGTLGLGLIGTLSLRRAYRTTLRLYTGQFTAGKQLPAPAAIRPVRAHKPPDRFLEKQLPWLSEQAAAIALGSFRSLVRAPEAKMLLLTPVFMLFVFGAMFFQFRADMSDAVRPLIAFGAMAMILFTLVQLVGNQFGFDRSGFRVFVLCPARRSDILLGKNLALAPLAFALCAVAAAFVQIVYPLRVDHFLAVMLQFLSMYLLFCLLANTVSILAPMAVAPGTMRPTNTKIIPVLLNIALVILLPAVLAPTLLPLAVELGLETLGVVEGLPICLVLTLLLDVGIIFFYRLVLKWQGDFLQAREQKILEIVAAKAE
jgi:hypothetical protein